jgi:CubicO group peptidase (beta-lactamase class C family)
MRWHPGSLLLALMLAAGCDAGPSPIAPGDVEAFSARLEELRMSSDIPGVAAAVAQDGQVVWHGEFGLADVESGVPVTPETSFHLASLTKPFASTILMGLVEEGVVGLDDPVSDYGLSIPSPGVITVRHLLTHTSEGEPGSRYRYNGDRFALLDQVILHASGRRFSSLLVERVIHPLNLLDTAPNVQSPTDFEATGYDRAQFIEGMAQGYTSDGNARLAYAPTFSSAAGLIASVEDVIRFSNALDQNELLSAATQAQAYTPATSTSGLRLPYGLGWFVQDYRGVRLVWHYGLWIGCSSLIVKVPSQGLTFVMLANSDMLSRPYSLGSDADVRRSPYARAFVDAFVDVQ